MRCSLFPRIPKDKSGSNLSEYEKTSTETHDPKQEDHVIECKHAITNTCTCNRYENEADYTSKINPHVLDKLDRRSRNDPYIHLRHKKKWKRYSKRLITEWMPDYQPRFKLRGRLIYIKDNDVTLFNGVPIEGTPTHSINRELRRIDAPPLIARPLNKRRANSNKNIKPGGNGKALIDLIQIDMDIPETIRQALITLQTRDITPNDYALLTDLDVRVKPKTIDHKSVKSLPMKIVKDSKDKTDDNSESDENEKCSICMEEYKSGDKLRELPCLHAFHSDCIEKWLIESSVKCPLDGLPIFDNL